MLSVKQFRYASDNLGYLVFGKNEAAAIDGGAVDDILSFVSANGLSLKYVLNTHSHYDHTSGNKDLLARSAAAFLDNRTLRTQKTFTIDGEGVAVYHTPGHMEDCLTFHAGNSLITGDTLFTGTVGNCFSGDLKGFFESIRLIMTFPDDTLIYPGHDYVREALVYGKSVEPENIDIIAFLENYDPGNTIVSTLADERNINLFLRFNEEKIINLLKAKNLPVDTEFDRWTSLMNEF